MDVLHPPDALLCFSPKTLQFSYASVGKAAGNVEGTAPSSE